MRAYLSAFASTLLLVTSACAGGSTTNDADTAPETRGKIRVENRTSQDMDIYILPSLDRPIRLGFAPASETVEFALNRAALAGKSSFFLQGRPVRGSGNPVTSEPFTVGNEIVWSIPPQ